MTQKKPLRATDHRALVLEAAATCPVQATLSAIVTDCESESFPRHSIECMTYQLRKEGLIGVRFTAGEPMSSCQFFITEQGLDWLTRGRFDKALPAPHDRPKSRRRKKVVE